MSGRDGQGHRVGTRTTATEVMPCAQRGAATARRRPAVAVLAVQGAFLEHERRLVRLGAQVLELRQVDDLKRPFDALVLPGGESTAQGKLLRDLGMLEALRARIATGLPTLGTCAGMILLAERVVGSGGPYLATLPITVRRNAYGRQLESFHAQAELAGCGRVPMTFIRAPFVEAIGEGVQVLASVAGNIVAVRSGSQIALAFHPELDASDAAHELLLKAI